VEQQDLPRRLAVPVDLIRTIAIIGVILLHVSGRWIITPQEINQLTPLEFSTWAAVDIYQSLAALGVPLFIMLTGALLLQPGKNESLSVFFKKRWIRIGLPFLFWCVVYFAWDFLVMKIPFTAEVIILGILNGPYTQFWYLYVLAGLYLLTPILRIFITHADKKIIKYFVILWVIGVSLLPFFGLFTIYTLSSNVFTITGYVGFFVLGTYLTSIHIPRRSTLWTLMVSGIALTAIGTYALAATVGGTEMYFFQQYFSLTIILTSVSLFLLLLTIKPKPNAIQKEPRPSKVNILIKAISQNTLAIFFIHVMIIEAIQLGFFGFTINRDTLNPVIEAPLLTLIVLFVSLAIILILKRIPYLNKLIGAVGT
jgi:surface polysaccharide O-acyltransferase-like enzyme